MLDELEVRLGSRPVIDSYLKRYRVTPTTDWAGRPMVPTAVAERILREHRAAQEEGARLVSAYDAYLRDRTRRLLEAGDEAHARVAQEELKKQYETPWPGGDGMGYASGGVTYTGALNLWPRGRQMAREARLRGT